MQIELISLYFNEIMKKGILITAVLTIVIFSGFKIAEEFKINHAEVEQVQGIYVFYRSKPVRQYDYLGTVKTPFIIKNDKGSYLVDLMVKRAKEKHASCNAIIFKSEDLNEVDAVIIK